MAHLLCFSKQLKQFSLQQDPHYKDSTLVTKLRRMSYVEQNNLRFGKLTTFFQLALRLSRVSYV